MWYFSYEYIYNKLSDYLYFVFVFHMSVDINLVKELRSLTHAPLKDCKAVLVEANGDIDRAQELLREKGILKAAKKADRETNNGVVKFVQKNGVVAGVKLLCETDFVAKNETFLSFVDELLELILDADGEFDTESAPEELKDTLETKVKEQVGTIGENLQLAMVYRSTKKAYVYNHTGNTIATVLFYDAEGDVEDVAKEVALQATAMNPSYVSFDEIPQDVLKEVETKYLDELKDSSKPDDIKEKIVKGRVFKHFQDDVLLEQSYIRDGSKSLKDVVGDSMNITEVLRVTVG